MSSGIRAALTPKSIRAQLTLWYLLMTAGALAAFAVFVFVARERTLYREADAELALYAQRMAEDLRPKLLETIDLADALAADPRLADLPLVVRERQGSLIYRSPAFPSLGGPAEAAAIETARGGNSLDTIVDREGREYRVATAVVNRTGTTPIVIQTTAPTAPVERTLNQLLLAMLLWSAVVLAAASYGGRFIARRALQPVDEIVARVRAIEATALAERVDVRVESEELDRLVATLNGMLDRLATSMQGARRFAADASHELQTPIAAMRAALDTCLSDEHADADAYRAVADDLVDELERLSALVRDLRLLALADAGHLIDRVEPIDLAALTVECCEIVHAAAEPKAIAIEIESATDTVVRGNTLHLRRALLNLAHNAVRYSPAGATVHVSVRRLDAEAIVDISDEGCGIPSQDLPHIFERFYRADKARARDTGGTGLGLAIADQIIRSHGGRIDVASAVDRGSTFAVHLPLFVNAA